MASCWSQFAIGSRIRSLAAPLSLALGEDAEVYIGTAYGQVLRLARDNWLDLLGGSGEPGYAGDGGLAKDARFGPITDLALSDDGTLFVNDTQANGRIRLITPNRRVLTLAGGDTRGFSPDRRIAFGTALGQIRGFALDADARLYFGEDADGRQGIRRIASSFAGFFWQDRIKVLQGEMRYEFDGNGHPQRAIDLATGSVQRRFDYDADGYLSAVVDENGRVLRIERDGQHRVTALLAPNGQRTHVGYDEFSRPRSVTQPDGAVWGLAFDARRLLRSFVDPNGHETRFGYDNFGRVLSDTDAAEGGWLLAHDIDPAVPSVRYTTAEGRSSSYRLDTSSASSIRTSTTIGPADQRTLGITDPIARTRVDVAPDGSQREVMLLPSARPAGAEPELAIALRQPSGLITELHTQDTWTDTAAGSLLTASHTRFNGKLWTSRYEPATRISSLGSPEGRSATIHYDKLSRPLRVQIAGEAPTHYSYDERGLLDQIVEGEGDSARTTTFGYDDREYLNRIEDPRGRVTEYQNDPLGRTLQTTLPDGRSLSFAYDPKGNTLGLTPPGRSEHAFAYSPVDLPTDYTPPAVDDDTGAVAAVYNKDRDLLRQTHAPGHQITYSYDDGGRIQKVNAPEGSTAFSYRFGSDQLTRIARYDGQILQFDYDGSLPTTTRWAGEVEGSVTRHWNADLDIVGHTVDEQHHIDYAYDRDGLLTQAGDLSIVRDAQNGRPIATQLGRITTERSYTDFGELDTETARLDGEILFQRRYAHDQAGRIVQVTETLQGQTHTDDYHYDLADRLIEVRRNGTAIGRWDYDDNGNRIQIDDQPAASYDAQDRLQSYANTPRPIPSADIHYRVDGLDRRIAKTLGEELQHTWLYQDTLNPIAERDPQGRVTSLFVHGTRSNVPAYLVRIDPDTGETRRIRILTDHLGSPRLLVDVDSGEIVQRMAYDPWGVVVQDTAPGYQPFGFAGGLYDTNTGLVRFGARDYDPYTGRWTAKDPIGFAGGDANLYGYVLGDPINFVDPLGNWAWGDPLPDWLVDSSAGFGDTISNGLTDWARDLLGTNGVVNKCSSSYGAGEWAGIAYQTARSGIGGLKAAQANIVAGKSRVQANKAAGDAFEGAIGAELRATHEVVAPQVTIRTPSGTRTRVDFVTRDGAQIGCVECKASATAPLTRNQAAAFPEIQQSGGVVVGKGKPGVPGGTIIPPGTVTIRRP